MTERITNSEREALITGGRSDTLEPHEAADVPLLAALLADRATWAEPRASLEHDVIQAVDFHGPDVVLLDLNFPEADGLSILGHLHRRNAQLPVIVMTAFGNIDIENRVRALGAVAYFDKPFRLDALLRTLRSICRPESAA